MAINLKFDLMGNPEPPSIVLANRNGNKLGQLNVDPKSIDVKDLLKTSEFSFTLNKYIDGELTNLWDKVMDFKLVYCPEWDLWYEIKVELDEDTETVKTVFCTQLGQAELSQIKVYNIEINTEDDIARDNYKISILYDEDNKDASIFHRVMSKAPHYSVAYIDESLKRIQKSLSFDDASICDVFDEIEEEVGCLVVYNSNSDKNGMPKRDVSVYDLLQNCKNPNCKHRGEFTDKCPKCGGTDIDYGYGEDTTIFVTSDELATEGIQLVTDTDSVKNCFKLEAGDDLMTATVRNCNPNGSDYIWYFSDAVKEDMSKELVEAIESYDAKYKEYYDAHISNLDAELVGKYNALVEKYKEYYNTKSSCINCKHEGYFEDECPSCHSKNILIGRRLQSINASVVGYPSLMNAYYNTIDLALYLESGLMPSIETSETSAKEQLGLLTSYALSPVAVNVEKIDNISLATANSAVLSMAKVIVKPTYKVEIKEGSSLSNDKIWRGQFVITNYSDETDTATNDDDKYINVTINNDTENFIKQKIEKALNKENTDDLSISGLFDEEKYDYDAFCAELKKYALNPLKSFYDACEACLSILTEQGTGDKDVNVDLYTNLYEPYYKKSQAIANEIKVRENEISLIKGVYDETDEESKNLITKGLQTNIADCQSAIHEELNFEEYLKKVSEPVGRDLWLEFCAYRREDKYSNSNYVSDGLNNAELFERALEFVEVAENEIFKSAELQHSISTSLNNLLSLPKFKHLIKYFKTGNWIRVRIDDRIFKLRLLEYNFSYGDLESISVEFSDVTKIKNGTTDVQDIFSQASSIASSYDSVQRQAKKGDVARSTIDQWLVDGLKSADVEIKNNISEEVLITKNGLLARSYSDITGTYSPEQLKITHNIMAYTDDNWETVRQAIGKHNYKFYNESEGNFADKIGYGMNADFVTAGVVSGSQMIGGDIYSNNYSKTVVNGETVTTGSYIDLEEGKFSLAGGKLAYDGGDLTIVGKIEVTTSGRIGCWDINGTSIYKGSAAFGDANGMYFGTNGLSLGDDFKVEPSGLATMTNVNIKNGGTIAGFNIGNTSIYKGTNSLTSTTSGIYLGTDGLRQYSSKEANVTISNGILTANGANISGTITSSDIVGKSTLKVGEYTDDDNNIYYRTWIAEDGVLNAEGANISNNFTAVNGTIGDCTITNASIGDCEITGGSLRMGNVNDGYSAWISVDEGVLNANGVNISGEMHVADRSTIAGFTIDGDSIYKGVLGQNDSIFLSTTNMDGVDGFFDGKSIANWRMTVGDNFGVTSDGYLYASDAKITGRVVAKSGYVGNLHIEDGINGYVDDVQSFSLTQDGLFMHNSLAKIQVGKFEIFHKKDEENNSATILKTWGALSICGTSDANGDVVSSIDLLSNEGSTAHPYAISLRCTQFSSNPNIISIQLISSPPIMSTETFVVSYQYSKAVLIGTHDYDGASTYSKSLTIKAGETESNVVSFQQEVTGFWDTFIRFKTVSNTWIGDIKINSSMVGDIGAYGTITQYTTNQSIQITGNIVPKKDAEYSLGQEGRRWSNIWAQTGTIQTSDKNQKNNIQALNEYYENIFDDLKPVSYKFNNNTSDRVHMGFIAQDVKHSIIKSGLTTQDFAGYCEWTKSDGALECGLRYDEFIPLCVDQIQKLKKRVAELENK